MALSSSARALRALVSLCLLLPLLAFASGSAGVDARVVWLTLPGSVLKVTPADGSVALQLPALKQPDALAVEGANDTVWVYGQKAIVAFDHSGNSLLTVNLPHNFHGGTPQGMAVDNTAGNIWIAIQKELYCLDMGGTVKADLSLASNATALSLDTENSQVWVAEQSGVEVFDASGHRQLQLAPASALTALAYDAKLDQVWMLSAGSVSRYSSAGQQTFSAALGADLADFIAPDGQGGAWVAGVQNLAYLAASGQSQFVIQPFAGLSGSSILGLVADAVNHSAWVANSLHLRHYDTGGNFLLEAALPVGPGNGNGLQQLGYYVDTIPPTVSIAAPKDGLWTNHNQPTITLTYSDNTGVDPTSITLTANDQPLAVTCQPNVDGSGASCTPTSAMPDGGYTLAATVADYAGNLSKPATVFFHILTVPPTITVTNPTGPYTNQPHFNVTGNVNQPGVLTINGADVPLAADGTFSDPVTLVQGDNTLTFVATDLADNVTTLTKTLNLNTVPPVPVVNGDINVVGPTNGLVTLTGKPGSVAPNVSVTITDTKTGQSVTVTSDASGAFTATLAASSNDSLQVTETDKWGNVTSDPNAIAVSNLPPDPASVAPPLSTTGFTTFADQTSFLYTGTNPIQAGVAAGALDPATVSVIRGKVLDVNGNALPGATVTVFGHPELGHTLSRADGYFDIAVNGGGTVTLDFTLKSYLPAQRKVQLPWNAYTSMDTDVALIQPDSKVTPVAFGASVDQLVQGSVISDARGTRQLAAYFPAGTTATMVLPDGSTQALTSGSFRATEFTVGTQGAQTMPADLAIGTQYTYAVDLSFDEARAAGAQTVTFSKPVPVYVGNFLKFPTGYAVPNYYLDPSRGEWTTNGNGDVVKVLSLDVQGNAVLDVDGSGNPASAAELSQLGITPAELHQIGQVYAVGATFWRFQVTHFCTYDFNAACKASYVSADTVKAPNPPCDHHNKGCDISVETQTLGEDIPVTGTPFVLRYDSSRQPGYTPDNVLHIQVTGPTMPANLQTIVVRLDVAGQEMHAVVKPIMPNQIETFYWDGHDRYGRVVHGQVGAYVHVGYVSNPVTYFLLPSFPSAVAGHTVVTVGDPNVATETAWNSNYTMIGDAATPPQGGASGVDGWSLSVHHALDPATHTVYFGDGSVRRGSDTTTVVRWFTGCCGFLPRPAALTRVGANSIAIASNGDIYFAGGVSEDGYHSLTGIFKIDHTTTMVTQVFNHSDSTLRSIALAPDGSIYYVTYTTTSTREQIYRWSPDGTTSLVAGIGVAACPAGDNCNPGGPATQALLESIPKISVGPDGTLYFLRKAAWDGSTSVAEVKTDGTWKSITPTYDNWVWALAAAPDGSVYFGGGWSHGIFQWKPDQTVTQVAGGSNVADGNPANQTTLSFPTEVYVAADGTWYINDYGRIRRVGKDGIMTTVAGGGTKYSYPEPAIGAAGLDGTGALGPDGTLKFAGTYGLISVEPAVPGAGPILGNAALTGYVIPSDDGSQLYTFDRSGRHLQTVDSVTKTVIYSFGYDTNGNFVSVTDANNRVTTINRDAAGNATSIVSPDGQVTKLTADGNGYLSSVTDPAGDAYKMATRPDGILTTFIDPKGNADTYSYNILGELYQNQNAVGGGLTLARSEDLPNFTVTTTSAGGLNQSYRTLNNSDGTQTLLVTAADGTVSQSQMNRGADSDVNTAADGTVTTSQYGADPRFGADVKLPTSESTKTPSGLTLTTTMSRAAPQANPDDVFSFTSLTDTVSVNGQSYISTFAPITRTWTSTSPMGRKTTTVVDALNRPVNVRFGNLNAISYSYDANGHIQVVTAGSGTAARTTKYTYYPTGSSQGLLQSVTDPLNRSVSYQYDAAGRVSVESLSDGQQIQFGYDASGNLTSLTPPSRTAHNFDYDDIDEIKDYAPPTVAGVTNPATQYNYNLDRQLTQVIRPDDQAIVLGYDTGGRLSTVTIPTGIYQYTYLPVKGQLQGIAAPGGESLAYTWDGSLSTGVTWSGLVVGSVTRSFNNNFLVTSLSVNGNAVNYGYDNDELITSAGSETLKRDAVNGFISGTTLGAIATAESYDGFGAPLTETADVGSASLYNATYTRDNDGRISGKTEIINGVNHNYAYGYDDQGQLNFVSTDGIRTSYDYDVNGNRTTVNGAVVAAYDDQDRLISYGSSSYSYTANGELQTKTDAAGQTDYRYDALGNLLEVKLPSGTDIQYVIDGQNRRVGKKVNGTFVQGFLYQNQLNPVAELDGSGNVLQRYVYGSRTNVPDYIIQGSNAYKVIADQIGSPRLVVDSSTGNIVEQIDYDAWGNVINDTNPGFQPFGFAGGLYDQDTALYHFGARDYDSRQGRWLRKDPTLFAGGETSLYGYAGNDPVNFVDSSGLYCLSAKWINIISSSLGGAAAGAFFGATKDGLMGALVGAGLGLVGGAIAGEVSSSVPGDSGKLVGNQLGDMASGAASGLADGGGLLGAVAGTASGAFSGTVGGITPDGGVPPLSSGVDGAIGGAIMGGTAGILGETGLGGAYIGGVMGGMAGILGGGTYALTKQLLTEHNDCGCGH